MKIHVVAVVNINTKKILSIKVTNEHVYDSKALPEFVSGILRSDKMVGNYLLMVVLMLMCATKFSIS